MTILLFNCERDKDLKPGEAILVFKDGKTKRVTEKSLYGKEIADVRQPQKIQRPSLIRSRPVGGIKHREADIRRTSPRKRAAVHKA